MEGRWGSVEGFGSMRNYVRPEWARRRGLEQLRGAFVMDRKSPLELWLLGASLLGTMADMFPFLLLLTTATWKYPLAASKPPVSWSAATSEAFATSQPRFSSGPSLVAVSAPCGIGPLLPC